MKAVALLSVLSAVVASLVVAIGGTAAPGPCQPGDVLIEITSYAFTPASITVTPGTTVCWTNKALLDHTATSDTAVFDSGNLQQNDSYRFTFPTEGTFPYHCAYPTHGMSATIVVSATAPPPPPPSPPPAPPPPPPASPPALAVSGVRITVERRGARRALLARARITRPAVARLSLMRRQRTHASSRKSWRTGANTIRTTLPRSVTPGRWTAVLQVGSRRFSRNVSIG